MIDLFGFMLGVQCPGYRCRHGKPASAAGIPFVDFASDGEREARCQLKRLAPPRRSPLLFPRLVLLASRASDRELIICIAHGEKLDQMWIISGGTFDALRRLAKLIGKSAGRHRLSALTALRVEPASTHFSRRSISAVREAPTVTTIINVLSALMRGLTPNFTEP